MQMRYRRCRSFWDIHYRHCREVVRTLAEECKSKRTVIILGAGSLHDLPLDYLAKNFHQVKLVDLLFLSGARRKVESYSNVTLIEQDISCSLQQVFTGSTAVSEGDFALNDDAVDLVVSMNVLGQLPLIPVKWLEKMYRFEPLALQKVSQDFLRHHLNYLRAFHCPVCLISDREIQTFNQEGQLVDSSDIWWGLEPVAANFEWDWEIAPFGELDARTRQVRRVGVSVMKPH